MLSANVKKKEKKKNDAVSLQNICSISAVYTSGCVLLGQWQANVDQYMQDPANPSAEVVIRRFDEQHNKYKFMEANLSQKKNR